MGKQMTPSYRHHSNTSSFDVTYNLGLSRLTELQEKLYIVPITYFWSSSSAAVCSTSPRQHMISSTWAQASMLLREVRLLGAHRSHL